MNGEESKELGQNAGEMETSTLHQNEHMASLKDWQETEGIGRKEMS